MRVSATASLTLHRPSNVDDEGSCRRLLSVFKEIAREIPVVYPVHPRAKARIAEFGLQEELACANGLFLTEPLGYLDFLQLTSQAAVVFTDSGGLQEETTYLGVPCITLRENTERPITLAYTNVLAGIAPAAILEAFHRLNPDASAHGPTREAAPPAGKATPPSSHLREAPASHPKPTSPRHPDVPPLWDGHAAERICAILSAVTTHSA